MVPDLRRVIEDLTAGADHEVVELGCFVRGALDETAQLFEIAAVVTVVVEFEGPGREVRLEIVDRVREFR